MKLTRALGFVLIAGLATTAAAEENLPDVNGPYSTPNFYYENGYNFYYDSDDAFWDSNPFYGPYIDYFGYVLLNTTWT